MSSTMSSYELDEKPSFDTHCPNCNETYRVTDIRSVQVPLILVCNHSCCERCIKDSIISSKGQVVCRKCGSRSFYKLAGDPTLRNLRETFPVAACIVSEMRAAQKPRFCDESQISFSLTMQPKRNVNPIQPAEVPSDICFECVNALPVLRCTNCASSFCRKCSDDVHAKRATSNHELIPLFEDVTSCASDSSGSVYHNVKELEHRQIIEELLVRSEIKIKTIEKSLQALKDCRAIYDVSSTRYDKIEKECNSYFEQIFNMMTRKRNEMLNSIQTAKSSWRMSSKNCEKELTTLSSQLSAASKRLRAVSQLAPQLNSGVPEHMKRIDELLKKNDTVVMEAPTPPSKEIKFTFHWVQPMEKECDMDFGSSGSVSLAKKEEDASLLSRDEMMHPNYDYSTDDYDFGNVGMLPGVLPVADSHRTSMVSERSLSYGKESIRTTSSVVSDVTENRSSASYHSSPNVLPSNVKASGSKKASVASQISTTSSSVASCNRNGFANDHVQTRPVKSFIIHSNSRSNTTSHSESSKKGKHVEASHVAPQNAAVKKQQKTFNPKKFEDISRIIDRMDTFHNVHVSHVIDPTCFYVQLRNIHGYFAIFADEFSTAPSWSIPTLDEIPKGTLCITLEPNGQRHRVRIEHHERNSKDEKMSMIKVFYMDFGHKDEITLSSLRLPKGGKKKLAHSSPLALRCGLYDCFPVKGLVWKDDVIDTFKSYIADKKLDLHISKRTPSKMEVDLMVLGNYITVRQFLLDAGKATVCSEVHNVVPLHFADELSYLYDTDFHLNHWIDVRVSHIVSPFEFYAQREDSESALEKLGKQMDRFYKNERNFKAASILNPYVGQKIAAKYDYDGRWYRAEILKIHNVTKKKFYIRYVDYGNNATVDEKSIARLSQEFFKVTVQAFKCTLRDILPVNDEWHENTVPVFRKCVDNAVLQMVVQEKKKEDVLSVSLYKKVDPSKRDPISVQKLLIQKGLARGVGELAGIKSLASVKKKKQPKTEQQDLDAAPNENERTSEIVVTNTTTDDHSSEVLSIEPFGTRADETKHKEKLKPPAKRSEVKVLRIYNPNKVYIHFIQLCPNLANITADLKIFYEDAKNNEEKVVETIVVKEKYAVFSDEDSEWYRGIVESCSGDEVVVDLLDLVEKKKTVSKDNIRSLHDKFNLNLDSVIKCNLVGFEEGHEDWSPEFCQKILAELAKYKELWAEIQRIDKIRRYLHVDLWGRNVKLGGPLDPMVEKWTRLNERFLKMERNDENDDDNSETSSQGYIPIVEKLQMLDEESDPHDTYKCVSDWLMTNKAPGLVNGSDFELALQGQDPESDGTMDVEGVDDDDDNLDSVSTVDLDQQWIDPPELKTDGFLGKVTHVDWGCVLFIQNLNENHEAIEAISNGLRSVYCNTFAKPDDMNWHPGQICIAFWPFDKSWYRARVKKVNSADNNVEVEYVDFGSDAVIPRHNLRKKISLLEIPIQCHKIPIRSDIKPATESGEWTKQVLDLIHCTIVDKICPISLRKEPGETFYRVEKLFIPDVGMDLFDYLLSLNHAVKVHRRVEQLIDRVIKESEKEDDENSSSSSGSSILAIERIPDEKKLLEQLNQEFEEANSPINCWTVTQAPIDDALIVSYFDVPKDETRLIIKVTEVLSINEIAINIVRSDDPAIEEGYKIYQKMTEDLQKEASQFPKLSPPYFGRICCTQFTDGVWYRGLIVARPKQTPNRVPVFYIDYGNVSFASVLDLRELKEDWYHIPMQSVKCVIDDIELPESKSEVEGFGVDLSNALLNQEFSAVIKESQVDERVYSIRLTNEDGEPPYHFATKSSKS